VPTRIYCEIVEVIAYGFSAFTRHHVAFAEGSRPDIVAGSCRDEDALEGALVPLAGVGNHIRTKRLEEWSSRPASPKSANFGPVSANEKALSIL
jgi:hypothetical protein